MRRPVIFFIVSAIIVLAPPALPSACASQGNPNFCAAHCLDFSNVQKATELLPKNNGGPSVEVVGQSCPDPKVDGKDTDAALIPLAFGARRAMALTYGSCEVLDLPVVENGNRKNGTNSYLEFLTRPECDDQKACLNPKKWQIQNDRCEMQACAALKKGLQQASQDGALLIAQALTLSGARMKPGKKMTMIPPPSSRDFYALSDGDCFDLRNDASDVFRPGDLIATRGQTAIIDTVGPDPFGVESNILSRMESLDKLQLFNGVVQEGLRERNKTRNYKLEDVLAAGGSDQNPEEVRSFLRDAAEVICDHEMDPPSAYKVTILHGTPDWNGGGVRRQKIFPGLAEVSSDEHYGQSAIATGVIENAKMQCKEQVRIRWQKLTAAGLKKTETNSLLVFDYPALKQKGVSHVLRYASHRPGCELDRSEVNVLANAGCVSCCSTATSYEAQTRKRTEK